MPRYKGAHLTWNDRLTIEKMLREGYSKPQIARYLGVHYSTVYDECRRGAVELKRSDLTTYISYSADVAKDYHLDRKKNMEKPLKIGKDHRLARWLVKTISEGYSPSAACSMLGKTPETTFSCTLCRQTVYKYIENGDLWPLTNKELRYKSDQKRTYNRVKAAKAPRGDSIEHRPEHINNREEPGHWEMDSVVGKKGTKAALCVLTGRVTRDEIIRKMHDDTAASVVGVLDRLERRYVPPGVQEHHRGQRERICRLQGHGALLSAARREAHPRLLLPPQVTRRARQQRETEPAYPVVFPQGHGLPQGNTKRGAPGPGLDK